MTSESSKKNERERRLQEALVAYLEAAERGQAPELSELQAQHAEFAAELAEVVANQEHVDRLAGPLRQLAEAAHSEANSRRTIGAGGAPAAASGSKVRYFGDYELLDEIARGGMGVVFAARQVSLNRTVALKMILRGELASESDVRRFHTEAEAAANLDHPNIVPIYEVGEHEGQHYFSMKLVEGGSLQARVRNQEAGIRGQGSGISKEEQQRAAQLVATVARAVHYAHQRGILHRDLKPANILLDRKGEPHVTDFGLAKRVEGDSGQTRTGAVVGTPSYMPPEQALGRKDLTTGADVYSLGAILYELLTGRPPFRGQSPLETLLQVTEREPQRPRLLNPRIDRDLETICLKCLEKEPARRYASAEHLADDLERWLKDEPIHARSSSGWERVIKWARRRPALATLGAGCCFGLLAVGVLSLLMWHQTSDRLRSEVVLRERAENAEGEAKVERRSAVDNAGRASDAMHASQARLARFYVLRGKDAADQGDRGAALQWYVEALKADNPVPQRQQVHRARIALLLQDMPRLRLVLPHEREVRDAIFTPDGRSILSFASDRLHTWDVATGRPLQPPRPLEVSPDTFGHFTPDGKGLLTQESVGHLMKDHKPLYTTDFKVWDTQTARRLGPPVHYEGAEDHPPKARLTADRQRLVVIDRVSNEHVLHVIDPVMGKERIPAMKLEGRVYGSDLSPDGKHLAVITVPKPADNQKVPAFLSVWDVTTGKAALPTVKLVDVAEWGGQSSDRAWITPKFHQVLPQVLVVGHVPHRLTEDWAQLWDVGAGKPQTGPIYQVVHPGTSAFLGFSADGREFVLADDGGGRRRFDAATGRSLGPVIEGKDPWTIRHHDDLVTSRMHPDNRLQLCIHRSGKLLLWERTSERLTPLLSDSHYESVRKWQLGPAGDRIMVLLSSARRGPHWFIETRDAQTGRVLGPHIPLEDLPIPTGWAMSPDGRRLASFQVREMKNKEKDFDWPEAEKIIQLWDVVTGKPGAAPIVLEDHIWHQPHVFEFSADGRWLVTQVFPGFNGHRMFAWEAATGKPLVPPEPYDHIEFSPDGRRILTAQVDQYDKAATLTAERADKSAKVWDLQTGQRLGPPLTLARDIHREVFSPDGSRVLVSEYDRGRVWDVASGRPLHEPVEFDGNSPMEFSPDGTCCLTVRQKNVNVWDAATGRPLVTLPLADRPTQARFTPDGYCILTATTSSAQLWDASTGEDVSPPLQHADSFSEAPLQVNRDGSLVFARIGGEAEQARVWSLSPEARPVEDLEQLAQLLSGHRLDDLGQRVPLQPAEVGQLWQQLRDKYPETFGLPQTVSKEPGRGQPLPGK